MRQNALQLGLRYLNGGDLDKAEEAFRTLLRNNPHHAQGWCLFGLVHQAVGKLDEALECYREAVRLDPFYADPHNNLGWLYNQLGKPAEAIDSLRTALQLRREFPEACNNLGNAYLLQGRTEEALTCFREAIRLHPTFAQALHNAALILLSRRRIEEAITLLERALQAKPTYADALVNLSWAYLEKGDWERCRTVAREAIRVNPQQPAAYNNLGNALLNLGRPEEAAEHLQTALRLRPDFSSAWENLGLTLIRLHRLDEAVACLERAVRLEPAKARIRNNLAFALTEQGRWTEAAQAASDAIRCQPDLAEAYNNLGLSYLHLKQPALALAALEQAVRLRPAFPGALGNLGWALLETGQRQRAIHVLREALRILPDFPDALNNLGLAYSQPATLEEARASYEAALRLQPDFPEALGGLANVFKDLGRLDEALACYRKSLALNPRQPIIYSNFLFALHYAADVSPQEIFHEHLHWARQHAVPAAPPPPHANEADAERRLRLGYVSADLRDHVVGWYTERIVAAHDRRLFEVFCYANNDCHDDTTQRIRQRADHWRPIGKHADDEVERMIRRDRIDILVDLSCHSGGNRLTLFARKPAPVQVTHHGLPYTTANPAIDYRITDEITDPPGMTECYNTEQLVRLPQVAWCYRPNLSLPVNELPALSSGHLTFGFFGNFPKITVAAIAAWSQILKRLPGSRFLVRAEVSSDADRRLRDAFAARGIDADRLTLVGRGSQQAYFDLYRRIDISLDSFPYTGCNTTADALWMGVPVVMLAGRTGMSRQGASLLALVELRPLITATVEEYVEVAVHLAGNLSRLAELRSSLRERMSCSILMDPANFTRRLEDAYRWMWRRWCGRTPKEAAGA